MPARILHTIAIALVFATSAQAQQSASSADVDGSRALGPSFCPNVEFQHLRDANAAATHPNILASFGVGLEKGPDGNCYKIVASCPAGTTKTFGPFGQFDGWQCVQSSCPGTQPAPVTTTLACPAGQTGAIVETTTYSCTGSPSWLWTGSKQVSNTCTAISPAISANSPAAITPDQNFAITWSSLNASNVTYACTNGAAGPLAASGSLSMIAGAPTTISCTLTATAANGTTAVATTTTTAQCPSTAPFWDPASRRCGAINPGDGCAVGQEFLSGACRDIVATVVVHPSSDVQSDGRIWTRVDVQRGTSIPARTYQHRVDMRINWTGEGRVTLWNAQDMTPRPLDAAGWADGGSNGYGGWFAPYPRNNSLDDPGSVALAATASMMTLKDQVHEEWKTEWGCQWGSYDEAGNLTACWVYGWVTRLVRTPWWDRLSNDGKSPVTLSCRYERLNGAYSHRLQVFDFTNGGNFGRRDSIWAGHIYPPSIRIWVCRAPGDPFNGYWLALATQGRVYDYRWTFY